MFMAMVQVLRARFLVSLAFGGSAHGVGAHSDNAGLSVGMSWHANSLTTVLRIESMLTGSQLRLRVVVAGDLCRLVFCAQHLFRDVKE